MNRFKLFLSMLGLIALSMTACDDNDPIAEPPTPPEPPQEIPDFEIGLSEATSTSVKMNVTPKDENAAYYFDLIQKETFETEHKSDWNTYVDGMIKYLLDEGKTLEEILAAITTKGVSNYEFKDLSPATDYLAVAMGIDEQGKISTKVAVEPFTTENITSKNTFELKVTKTEFDNVEFEITPSNEDSYFYAVYPKAFCDRRSDEEMLNKVLDDNYGMIDFFLVNGKSTVTRADNFTVWNTDTSYYIIVFGYESGVVTTQMNKFEVRTSKPTTAPADVKFTFTTKDITTTGFTVNVSPSDKTVQYLWDILPKEEYEKHKNNMKAFVENYIVEAGLDNLDQYLSRDDEGNSFSHLNPNSEYFAWCVCMDEMGKTQADVQCSDVIKTAAPVIGESKIECKVEKYFNGDDLYKLNPEKYATARGKAYVSVTFKQDDKAAMWFGTLSEEDLTSPQDMSDEDVIKTFEGHQDFWFPTTKLYLCNWDAPYTVLAVAKDKQGNYSEIVRQLHTFTRDKAAPISEFVEPEETPQGKAVKAMSLK